MDGMGGTQAIGLLGDLLERNYIPSDFLAHMEVLFRQAFTILHRLVEVPPSAELSEYTDKCNNFFWQFSSNYFGRIHVRSSCFPSIFIIRSTSILI